MPKKQWVWAPAKSVKPKVPAATKAVVQTRADELIEAFYRPEFVYSVDDDQRFNFVTDIWSRWRGSFFTFGAVWSRVDEETGVAAPAFEAGFARLEYTGEDQYSLAFMCHTDKWAEIYSGLSFDDAFKALREEQYFWPPT